MTAAFTIRGLRFAYPGGHEALAGIDLEIAPGDFVVVAGSSGSGKSSLLRSTNGLVPHGSGGTFSGEVLAFGRSTTQHRPRDLAAVVGFVHQDPEAQFVVDRVEHDLAFALENLGVDEVTMRRRVEEVMDALGIAHLRERAPGTLSGGEQQRCAIAGALAAAPAALVLDEPTSQLDPQGADDVLAALARLRDELGTTVVLAEHRLDRAAPMADRAVIVEGGRVVAAGEPGTVLAEYPGAPPVVQLGRLMGWTPVPLTVREARRLATDLAVALSPAPAAARTSATEALVTARGVGVEKGGRRVLGPVDISVGRSEVVALLGRNGAGKTTLLRALAGLSEPDAGQVDRPGTVAYVPQDPNSLLFSATVGGEVAQTLKLLGRKDGASVARWLEALGLTDLAQRHPRSLSGGERQRVAIAAVAVGGAELLLLDEPTRGMDSPSRDALARAVEAHAAAGGAVVVATHDVELAARVATRVVVLGDGEMVADGPAAAVLSGSLFAPQMLRVLPPFLTVDQVAAAMRSGR